MAFGSKLSSRKRESIENLKAFIQIPSISETGPTDGTYENAVKLLKSISEKMGFKTKVFREVDDTRPILIVEVSGESNKNSLLLNCHYDVVPVVPEKWTHPPFSGFIDENNFMYGRGTQDMKSIGIQWLEALYSVNSKVTKSSRKLNRTVYVTFTPDEEVGSEKGMKSFVETDYFKNMNVKMAIDEGYPSFNDEFIVFLDQRVNWHLEIQFLGDCRHGSIPITNSAIQQATKFCQKVQEYNRQSVDYVKKNGRVSLGDRSTINMTGIYTSMNQEKFVKTSFNIVPPFTTLTLDIRVSPSDTYEKVESRISNWALSVTEGLAPDFDFLKSNDCSKEDSESGKSSAENDKTQRYRIKTHKKSKFSTPTPQNSLIFKRFKRAMNSMDLKFGVCVFPGATDSRFLRPKGVDVLNFTPMRNTPILLHDHDERISLPVFLEGVSIYEKILEEILL